ncbi:MAG: helix-turn-helix transcriptional regulator [Marinifilaceae bacterium]
MNELYAMLSERLDRIETLTIISGKNVLNMADVVLLTGLSKSRIYHLMSAGEIPYYKPTGKCAFFKKSEVEDWLFSNRVDSRKEIEQQATTYVATNRR